MFFMMLLSTGIAADATADATADAADATAASVTVEEHETRALLPWGTSCPSGAP